MHKQEIQNLKLNVQVHRKTLLESNPIVYVADVSNNNMASIVDNQKQIIHKLSMLDQQTKKGNSNKYDSGQKRKHSSVL